MESFYVYRYIRLDNNTPFYVGKGKGRRAKRIDQHNNVCNRIAEKHGFKVEYILDTSEESRAFEKEKEFIHLYKSLGYCEANFTDGGEGPSGYKYSKEQRQKVSNILKAKTKGKNNPMYGRKHTLETRKSISRTKKENYEKVQHPMYGRKHTLETKKKISEAQKGIKSRLFGKKFKKQTCEKMSKKQMIPVICIELQKEFESTKLAGESLNIMSSCITNMLKGRSRSAGGYTFKYKSKQGRL